MPLLDARGLAVSTSDRESLDRFEVALASLHGSHGDALTHRALARQPLWRSHACVQRR
jgi:hypothetical protein